MKKRHVEDVRRIQFFTTCTENYRPIFDVFRRSFVDTFGPTSIDNLHVHEYEFPRDISVRRPSAQSSAASGFQSAMWYHACRVKVQRCLRVLEESVEGSVICFTDCDIQFFPGHGVIPTWNDRLLARFGDRSDEHDLPAVDAMFMGEHESSDVNGGFVLLRVCDTTRALYRQASDMMSFIDLETQLPDMVRMFPFADQSALNLLLRQGVCAYETISDDLVVWGIHFSDAFHVKLLHHAVTTDDKLGQMDQVRRIMTAHHPQMSGDRRVSDTAPLTQNTCPSMPHTIFELVVCRYNESVDWVVPWRAFATIYDKSGRDPLVAYDPLLRSRIHEIPNDGREGETYLRHIIARYPHFAAITMFAQGRIDDHCDMSRVTGRMRAMIDEGEMVSQQGAMDYQGLSESWGAMRCGVDEHGFPGRQVWEDVFGQDGVPSSNVWTICNYKGVFAVTANALLARPLSFYTRALQVIEQCGASGGHALERMWQSMFTPASPLDAVIDAVTSFAATRCEFGSTPLCDIMTKRGCDKGNGWHNYTMFYHALFGRHDGVPADADAILNVFEVGQGRATVSALTGWSDYFPRAAVWGADATARHEEGDDAHGSVEGVRHAPRVMTFPVDQRASSSVAGLWTRPELLEATMDLVIDNGLHDIRAASVFLNNSWHKVARGGYYVIESVPGEMMADYARMAGAFTTCGTVRLFTLPNSTNTFDNNLMVIHRRRTTVPTI